MSKTMADPQTTSKAGPQVTGSPADFGWRSGAACSAEVQKLWSDTEGQIGVALQGAVPTYAMVDRAAKYGVLFLTLACLTLFLFETLSGVRIHIVQYGMVGLSISLFALLLISIAEPLGFTLSYAPTSALAATLPAGASTTATR